MDKNMDKLTEYWKVETDDAIKLRLAKETEWRRLMQAEAAETPEQNQERNKREAERKRKQRQDHADCRKLEQEEFDDIQKQLQALDKVSTTNQKERNSKELQIANLKHRSAMLKSNLDAHRDLLKRQADAKRWNSKKVSEAKRIRREAETSEQKQERNKREAERKRKQRQEQADHFKLEQEKFDDIQKQLQALDKVPTTNQKERNSKELQIANLKHRSAMLKSNLETRLERLKKQAEAKRLQRNNESEEKKRIRRGREAEYQRLRRASYSDEKKVVMKWREAERKRKLRNCHVHDNFPLEIVSTTTVPSITGTQFHMNLHSPIYLNGSHANSHQNIAKLREQFKPCNEIDDVLCHTLLQNKAITNICGNIKNKSKTISPARPSEQSQNGDSNEDCQNDESYYVYNQAVLFSGNASEKNNEIIEKTTICNMEPNDNYDSAYFEAHSNDSSLIPVNNDIVNITFDSCIVNGSSFEDGLNLFEDSISNYHENE